MFDNHASSNSKMILLVNKKAEHKYHNLFAEITKISVSLTACLK